jgi:hypothetical protein
VQNINKIEERGRERREEARGEWKGGKGGEVKTVVTLHISTA